MAIFISFEGGEGSGKSVQSQILGERLNNIGLQTLLIREPGSTPLGKYLREWLKRETSPKEEMSSIAELFVFAAARAEVVQKIIKPALKLPGMVIITDRFADSTTAYQGYGRKLSFDKITQINHVAMQGVKPDLTFLLDCDPQIALDRIGSVQLTLPIESDPNKSIDTPNRIDQVGTRRFEQESIDFHKRIRSGYQEMAQAEPARWHVVDGAMEIKDVSESIWNAIPNKLKNTEKASFMIDALSSTN